VFARQALLLVDFTRVHITLVRPGTEPPQVALDTTVDFPSDQDSLRLSLTVPLSVGATSEPFDLSLAMLNAAGAVVFRGGPIRVTATAGVLGGQAPDIPMTYVGAGANAAGVRFRAPVPSITFFGDTAVFAAEAFDSAGAAIAGTPVLYSVDPADSAKARVPDPAVGRVIAKSVRGPAAVVAQLLTGQTARTSLLVQPRPSAIALRSGGGQSAVIGAALAQPVAVRVTGADGLGVQGVSVAFAATSGGGSFTPSAAATDVNGDASATWTLGSLVGTQTATASVGAVASGAISATGTPASASRLAFTGQPGATTAGATMGVQVSAQDAFGNLYAAFAGSVTIALGANPGGATLSGTTTVAAIAGVATFSGLSLDKSGTGYTLVASTQGLTSATSAAFNVSAGAATTLALVSGGGQSALPSTLLPLPVVVKVTDVLGNGVSGRAVAFAVATGGGSVGTPSATTDATGSASTTWTLGAAAGLQTITATAAGLTGSPLTISATAGSAVATTTVTPIAATLNAFGQTVQLAAQAKDGLGANVAGSFTWVSRTPASATVNAAGLVTAVANGTSYVVVTEAGGTKDSALITVAQTLATINVAPGTRSIYLTGAFAFTAQAVDGRGNLVPGITSFTWSSTAPAVATVDTAGHVVGVGLGVAQIRAASGAITGVANLSVLTPITRIAVVVDTIGAAVADTFSFASLGLSRRYRGIAHDTLDAVMTGVAFGWVSSNGSVAVMRTLAGDTASVTSAANGVTEIRATAQGFTSRPGAAVTVAQVLAAIALTPPAPQIAVTGTVGLVARGLDANGRFISGGSFVFRSAQPAIATVDSLTGRVTGVALGTAAVTATSGPIVSNTSLVTVTTTVPPALSFGRDTVSVGRGSSASIPILLSTPAAAALTVNLTATAYAHWSPASLTIAAGQTAANATLVGDSAGTTLVTATDGSGLGYAPAAAVAKVTANMRLATGSFGINTTDIVSTQVLLSDPSPAGGTYVAFSYGTAGVASISPDPAFIPAGQLAADIQIRAIGAGTTTITPTAIGVNGTAASFTAYAPVLTISQTTLRLGQGQYSPDVYVYLPTYSNLAVPATFASSDTNVVVVPATVTIPAGNSYVYFTTTARGIGTATIAVSAPGWTSARTMPVTVTSPALALYGGGSMYTTSPAQTVTVYVTDSTRASHPRVNSLAVHYASRDTTVIKVLDTLVTVAPGTYYNGTGRVTPGALGGTTWLIATASGHAPDSVQFTVVGPPLAMSWGTNRLAAGQEDYSLYVYTPNAVTAPLTVTLTHSDSSRAGTPTSVTIPTGYTYVYFTVRGKVAGVDTIRATAPGFQAASASYLVTSPRLLAYGGGSYNNYGPGGAITVYAADSARGIHYRSARLTVTLTSTDTTKVKVDSATVTIDSGTTYNNRARFIPVDTGTVRIIVSAAGHPALDTLTVTVIQPRVRFSNRNVVVGRRQYYGPSSFYVYTPDYRTAPLNATITQLHSAVDSIDARALTIATSSSYAYYGGLYGLALGVDTLVVTAPGYLPDTSFVTVSSPRFVVYGMPGSATTTNPPIGITLYAADSLGSSHNVMDSVVVHAVSTDTTVIRPDSANFRLGKGASYVSTRAIVAGPGTGASITYSDSAGTGYQPATTGTITVTGPSLGLYNSTTVLGMRQTGGQYSAYAYTPNSVTAPLVVRLRSTDTRVVTIPDSIIITTGSSYTYFPVTAMDTVGTIQVQATAVGYSAATMSVQVTVPHLVINTTTQINTTSGRRGLNVYAYDASGYSHYVTEPVTVTLLSSAPSVAAIDSTTVTIPAGASYVSIANWTPGQVGTAQLSASDPRAARYAYVAGTVNVTVVQPTLGFSFSTIQLGIGQYDNQYVYAPDNQSAPLSVALAQAATPRTSLTVGGLPVTGVTIPAGTNYTYFHVVGTSAGSDTLTATATSPLHSPGVGYVTVAPGRVDPLGSWPASVRAGDSVLVYLYTRDATTNTHNVAAATTFTLAPNANIQFVSGGATSAVITSVIVAADASYAPFYLKGVTAGTGSVTITQANYQTYTPTVTVSP
jgi:uncharacterized protein YjdB